MEALKTIQKTREYLDYIERHILNVEKAWKEIQEKCKDMKFVWDDYLYHTIDMEVKFHDTSKLSAYELTQYRKKFCPTDDEKKGISKSESYANIINKAFDTAWRHHLQWNSHHWENWTKKSDCNPYEKEIDCAHMVIDWLAMSYEFGDTPRAYYEKNKDKIKLPNWAVSFIYEIFERLEK